jgi:hypothetical protein
LTAEKNEHNVKMVLCVEKSIIIFLIFKYSVAKENVGHSTNLLEQNISQFGIKKLTTQ